MSKTILFVIHSKCCKQHWEFGVDHNGELQMTCEKCGQGVGPQVKLSSEVLSARVELRPRAGPDFNACHTRCCGAHWEIVIYEDKTAALVCAKCGEAEPDVKVEILDPEMKCAVCGKGVKDGHGHPSGKPKCDRTGCANDAEYTVSFKLRSKPRDIPADAHLDVKLCKKHKEETKLDDLITDENWKVIEHVFISVGKAPPKRELTALLFEPIDGVPAAGFPTASTHCRDCSSWRVSGWCHKHNSAVSGNEKHDECFESRLPKETPGENPA